MDAVFGGVAGEVVAGGVGEEGEVEVEVVGGGGDALLRAGVAEELSVAPEEDAVWRVIVAGFGLGEEFLRLSGEREDGAVDDEEVVVGGEGLVSLEELCDGGGGLE